MSTTFSGFECNASSVLLDLFTCHFESYGDIAEGVDWFKYKEIKKKKKVFPPGDFVHTRFESFNIDTLVFFCLFVFLYSVNIKTKFLYYSRLIGMAKVKVWKEVVEFRWYSDKFCARDQQRADSWVFKTSARQKEVTQSNCAHLLCRAIFSFRNTYILWKTNGKAS